MTTSSPPSSQGGWELTPAEEERQAAWYAAHRRELYRQVGLRRGGLILEVGCGSGVMARELAAMGAVVRGVDKRPAAAAAARERGVEALVADARRLPFKDGLFDAVVTSFALAWFDDQAAFLRETERILKPGGFFAALAEPDYEGSIDYPDAASSREALIAAVEARGGVPRTGRLLPGLCAAAGLTVTNIGVINSVWAPRRALAEEAAEAALLRRLLGDSDTDVGAITAARRAALVTGERLYFLPIFYALARKT